MQTYYLKCKRDTQNVLYAVVKNQYLSNRKKQVIY